MAKNIFKVKPLYLSEKETYLTMTWQHWTTKESKKKVPKCDPG